MTCKAPAHRSFTANRWESSASEPTCELLNQKKTLCLFFAELSWDVEETELFQLELIQLIPAGALTCCNLCVDELLRAQTSLLGECWAQMWSFGLEQSLWVWLGFVQSSAWGMERFPAACLGSELLLCSAPEEATGKEWTCKVWEIKF